MLALALVSMNVMPHSSANLSALSLLMTLESERSHLLPIINISISGSPYKQETKI